MPEPESLSGGGHFYDVNHVRSRINSIVQYTKEDKATPRSHAPAVGIPENGSIQLRHRVTVKPYQTKIVQVKTEFLPGTSLVVAPVTRVNKQVLRMLVLVNQQQRVPVIIENATK